MDAMDAVREALAAQLDKIVLYFLNVRVLVPRVVDTLPLNVFVRPRQRFVIKYSNLLRPPLFSFLEYHNRP